MPQFTGAVLGATPVAGVANYVLETVSATSLLIKDITFGGEMTSTTAMRTIIARDSAVGTGTRTAGNVQRGDMHNAAQGTFFSTTYATLQPTIVAGCLWGTSWNAHGGVIRMLVDPTEVFMAYDAAAANASIECRASLGVGVSSYVVVFAEP